MVRAPFVNLPQKFSEFHVKGRIPDHHCTSSELRNQTYLSINEMSTQIGHESVLNLDDIKQGTNPAVVADWS